MKRITASLPTLGEVNVDFFEESTAILEFLRDREIRRLRRVPHLGITASVYTGVNHSRLEYVLLQCAIVGLIAKLHKHQQLFSISNSVKLDGLKNEISSGEELLKAWILLGNAGHANYTFGTERTVLQYAQSNPDLLRWLVGDYGPRDIRRWSSNVIQSYQDINFHYVLSLLRIRELPKRDRRKKSYIHLLRNLLLPPELLFPDEYEFQSKLRKLRDLLSWVRVISMATLDSYYSHNPIRVQLTSAIMNIAEVGSVSGDESLYDRFLRQTLGWLADQLYLSPKAVAAQRGYEIQSMSKLQQRFASVKRKPSRSSSFFEQLLWNGFGQPKPEYLSPLLRLSFESPRQNLVGTRNPYRTIIDLEEKLCQAPYTYVSVDRNSFTSVVHVDILYQKSRSNISNIAPVFQKLQAWLIRRLQAEVLQSVRQLVSPKSTEVTSLTERIFERRLKSERPLLRSVFDGLISFLLVEGMTAHSVPPSNRAPHDRILARITTPSGKVIDQIAPFFLKTLVQNNGQGLSKSRLTELTLLQNYLSRVKAPFVLVSTEPIVIRDSFGRSKDEWDGTIIAIYEDAIQVFVIESKSSGSSSQNENEAFKQLMQTRNYLCLRHRVSSRRKRLSSDGAVLICDIRDKIVQAVAPNASNNDVGLKSKNEK